MRHAVILAGGSGTRLWPVSRAGRPKQLLPLYGGASLLQLAFERLEGLIPVSERWICASEEHRAAVLSALPGLDSRRWIGEPVGRDTLAALALSAAVIQESDPGASIIVLTADHLIEPREAFQRCITRGLESAESSGSAAGVLVTFGITPTRAATGYGYLKLGGPFAPHGRVVEEFREKPDAPTAGRWVSEGPERYLWNGGMFAWKAASFLDCVRRYEPAVFEGTARAARAWQTPRREEVLREVYPGLRKISVDFAVMEKASRDPAAKVVAVPMSLSWKDVGSWPSYAETLPADPEGNAVSAGTSLLVDTKRSLVVSSDPAHLVAAFGCEDLVIVHTPSATLVCRRDRAEELKKIHSLAAETFGGRFT